ncbi:MAG: HD domain-containing protein, partial [Desulfobacterales bacterium]
IVSVIGLPFSVTRDISMLLLILLARPLNHDEKSPRLHTAVCSQASAAVKNAIQQSQYLETFSKISTSIHQGEEVEDILNIIVTHIQEIMEARGCIYWIVNTKQRDIHLKATSGFQMENLSLISYETLEEVFDFYSEKDIYFEDVREDPRIPSATNLGKQMVISVLGIPFPIVEPFRGILAVYFSSRRPVKRSEIEFVRDAGRQGAIALHKAFRYDERIFKAFQETIQGLVMAIEAKDVCTHSHSLNVAAYARLTALEMGLGEKEADTIYHAGLLHDIGKIAMEDTILRSLGNLTRSQVSRYDIETVEKHPIIGAIILEPLSSLGEVANLVKCHHERYDGKGYPEGLSGEDIPIGAKIIAVCDSFDVMTSERPGTTILDTKKAMAVLKMHSGTRFDPEVVRAFIQVIEKKPDVVKPFTLPEDYLTRHAETLNAKKKRSSLLSRLLKIRF